MNYDVVIVGGGIGGLTSAAILAKNGAKVILIERNDSIGGLCRSTFKNGYTFNSGVGYLWGFGKGEPFHKIFKTLKIGNLLTKKSAIHHVAPSLQVIMPENRLNIHANRNAMGEEVQREFPEHSSAIHDIYRELDELEKELFHYLPKRHPFSLSAGNSNSSNGSFTSRIGPHLSLLKRGKIPLSSLLHGKSIEVKNFFNLQLSLLSGRINADMPLTQAAILLGITRRGLFEVNGGTGSIIAILKEQILKEGGEILCKTAAEEIMVRRGRVCGVKARQEKTVIELRTNHVIANLTFSDIQNKLLKQQKGWGIFRRKNSQSKLIQHVPFTIHLGVDSTVIPEPMKARLILTQTHDEPLIGKNLLSISVSSENDHKRAPQGKRAITATYWLPISEASQINWKDEKDRRIEETIDILEQVVPFVSDYIETSDAMTPEDYRQLTDKEDGELWGDGKFSYGLPATRVKTPIKGLYSVSGTTNPFPGAAYVAKMGILAAEKVIKKM